MVKLLLPGLVATGLLASCATSHSTLQEGFAYAISRDQASYVVHSALEAYGETERPMANSYLMAKSYDRSATDTQIYTLTAVPVPEKNAYGIVLDSEGTMLNSTVKANRIYETAKQRAAQFGPRVDL